MNCNLVSLPRLLLQFVPSGKPSCYHYSAHRDHLPENASSSASPGLCRIFQESTQGSSSGELHTPFIVNSLLVPLWTLEHGRKAVI
jgi:hypothetical protein